MTGIDGNAAYRHWRQRSDMDGVTWLTLDRADAAVNTLGREVLRELEAAVDAAERTPPTGVVLLSGKAGSFIAGADVREFDQVESAAEAREYIQWVHRLFDRIEALPCPTVVAFEGYCLGGGLELALCFDYRIARDLPTTRIGFPEIKLGIFPGFGGSARTLEKLGAAQGLPFILQARNVNARRAKALGLVDEVVGPHQELVWSARRAVLGKRRSGSGGTVARLTNSSLARRPLAAYIRKQTEPRANPAHYPAPYALIDAWEHHGDDRRAMLQAEAEQVSQLLVGDTSRNLRRVFRLMERLKAEGKRSDFHARRVHVVGAGVMGGDIAAWCALRGLEVTLQDRELGLVEPAIERATALFRRKLKDDAAIAAARGRLRADVAGAGVARADVVIEAIYENLEAKQTLMRELEPQLKPDGLLVTNTSALDLAAIASVLSQPERLAGLHFFNPVASMPLVEIVHDPALTARSAVDRASAFAVQIDKLPATVRNSPGFLVNRVLGAYMAHALQMQQRGHTMAEIDHAAEWFGMPMGPVELADTVGLDVGASVLRTLGADARQIETLEQMVAAGRKGKKSGEGFYTWKEGKAQKGPPPSDSHPQPLAADLMQPYFDECRAALADGIVADADLLDAAMIFGTGFPPFRGGPLHYQNALGHAPRSAFFTPAGSAEATAAGAPGRQSATAPGDEGSGSRDSQASAASAQGAPPATEGLPEREPLVGDVGGAADESPPAPAEATPAEAAPAATDRPVEQDPLLGDVGGEPDSRTDRDPDGKAAGPGKGSQP